MYSVGVTGRQRSYRLYWTCYSGACSKNCGVCTPQRLGCACHEKGSFPHTITLEILFVSLLMNTHHVASQMNTHNVACVARAKTKKGRGGGGEEARKGKVRVSFVPLPASPLPLPFLRQPGSLSSLLMYC